MTDTVNTVNTGRPCFLSETDGEAATVKGDSKTNLRLAGVKRNQWWCVYICPQLRSRLPNRVHRQTELEVTDSVLPSASSTDLHAPAEVDENLCLLHVATLTN